MNHKFNVGDTVKAIFQKKVFEFEISNVVFDKSTPDGSFELFYKCWNEEVADKIEKNGDLNFYGDYALLFSEEELERMQGLKLGEISDEKMFKLMISIEKE